MYAVSRRCFAGLGVNCSCVGMHADVDTLWLFHVWNAIVQVVPCCAAWLWMFFVEENNYKFYA